MLAAGGAESTVGPSHQTTWTRLAILGVLLAAFALRSYHLDFQSFWKCEGISLNRASLALGEMLAEMPVVHMPGYFVALHGWRLLTGDHDFALRFLSLIPSVLAVALVYRLVADLDENWPVRWRGSGAIAAAFMATSGSRSGMRRSVRHVFMVVSQRPACELVTMAAAHASGAGPALRVPLIPRNHLGVYLHFYGFLVPIFSHHFCVGRCRPHAAGERGWRGWVLGLASVVLFLPWFAVRGHLRLWWLARIGAPHKRFPGAISPPTPPVTPCPRHSPAAAAVSGAGSPGDDCLVAAAAQVGQLVSIDRFVAPLAVVYLLAGAQPPLPRALRDRHHRQPDHSGCQRCSRAWM